MSSRASSIAVVALLALCGVTACSERPAPPLPPVDAVVRRLTGADFGLPVAAAHRPPLKIGDEARAIALGPRLVDVATLRGISLADDGLARHDVTLPEAVRALPDDAFRLDAQILPFDVDVPAAVFEFFANETFHPAVDTRWTLTRDATQPGVARLEVTPQTEQRKIRLNLDLRALLPEPEQVESAPFDVPPGASFELGYGIAAGASMVGGPAIRFRAVLRCASGDDVVLLDEVVSPDDGAWRTATRAVDPGSACRLRLHTTTPDGAAVRAGAWAEPLLLAPLQRGPQPVADAVILISLDTLRADHVSGYGYPRPTTPIIDQRLIERGAAFMDVSTTFPRTDVSHLSLFTGLFPEAQPAPGRLRAEATAALVTESLRDAGLITAAFTEDALIAGAFGFWFGFDRFVERAFAQDRRGHATFADGIDFLRANAGRRFFLFLHTYKTHKPYEAAQRYDDFAPASDWERLALDPRVPAKERPELDAYDRTVREADDLMGTLLDELDRLDLAQRTLVVVLSDHGEAFGEHVAVDHGYAGHQEQIRIPLVLRGPGVPAGLRVDTPASIVDVAPTILELAGAPPLPDAQGLSLAPALRGDDLPEDRPLFFSWLAAGARGVRHGRWKYLRADHGHELFDLSSDPGENDPKLRREPAREVDQKLLADHVAASAELRARFNAAVPAAAGDVPIDGRMHESLRALGYVD